jgi:hypothetical protein
MAITILEQPQLFAPIKNPLVLKLQTDNQWETAPVNSRHAFRFNEPNGVAADETITVTYNNNTIIFTFKASVDEGDPVTWIREKGGMESLEDWCNEAIIPVMAAVMIEYDFEYYYDGDDDIEGFTMVAKENGSQWNLTLASSNTAEINQWTALRLLSAVGVLRDNFRLFCRIFVQDGGGLFKFFAELDAHPDDDGIGFFYINRAFVFANSYAPNLADVVNNFGCTAKYYLHFGEKYGTPITRYFAGGGGSSTDYKIALNGGVATDVFPGIENYYTEWLSGAGHKLLNVLPRVMVVDKNTPMWLYYFLAATAEDTIDVNVELFFKNGTTDTEGISLGTVQPRSVTCLPIGPPEMAAYATLSELSHYTVEFERTSDNVKSEVFMFILSDIDFEFNRYFVYKNSLGTYEVLWCTGEAKSRTIHEYEDAKVMLPLDYTAENREILHYNKNFVKELDVPLGVNSRDMRFDAQAWATTISDLLNSDDVFEYKDGNLLPIVVLNKAAELPTDAQSMMNFDLKYRYAHVHQSFTPNWLIPDE